MDILVMHSLSQRSLILFYLMGGLALNPLTLNSIQVEAPRLQPGSILSFFPTLVDSAC